VSSDLFRVQAYSPLLSAATQGNLKQLGGPVMSQLFTTDLLPDSDRIDAWQWNAQQICGDCRIQLPRSSFHGAIEVRHVGGLPLTRFSSSPLSFWKWPSETTSKDNRSCIVITQLAGNRRYMQNGSSVLLNPGDSTLIDSGRPWSSSCGTDCTRLYLRVPRWMIENRLQLHKIPITQRICGTRGAGSILSRLSQSLYEEAERFQEDEGAAALDAYFQILSACLGRAESEEHSPPQLRSRIQRFIDDHLPDPGLRPAEIAAAADISTRHLPPSILQLRQHAGRLHSRTSFGAVQERSDESGTEPKNDHGDRLFLGLQRFRSLQSSLPQAVWYLSPQFPRSNRG
jgi:AraC-binding-like domain